MSKSSFFKFFTIFIISLTFLTSCSKKSSNSRSKEVIVYTYDSFISEWGPGPELEKIFESETDLSLVFVDCGDAVQVLSKALLEKDKTQADIVLGLDNNIAQRAVDEKILCEYEPKNAASVIPENVKAQLGDDWYLTPYDYSHFAFIYDTMSDVPCPKSLDDLLKPVYAKKIILMDPRTSTPGLGFLAWTVAIYGDKVLDYWKALKPNILTMAPGWSSGYGLFKQGEAPLVISYTTSPASHVEYDNTERYVAAIFDEGHSVQVEGAGILKNAPNKKGAQKFMDFLISDEAQRILPLTQWMNPANKNVELPESYKIASPIPSKTVSASPALTEKYLGEIMKILEN